MATPAVQKLLQNIFQEQVTVRPQALAICAYEDGHSNSTELTTLTYEELDGLSTRLASHLVQQHGSVIGPDTIVPILCEKSAATVICMLAVAKSGAAFLAVDVTHPDDRVRVMLEDVRASVLLVSPGQADRVGQLGLAGVNIVTVSKILILQLPPVNGSTIIATPPTSSSPDNVLYAVFTSGSTGRPKGVIVSHSAFITGAVAQGRELSIDASSRVLQFSSYAFDVSIMEIFTTLIHGGCVCIPREDDRYGNIVDFMTRAAVNMAVLTPSYARLLDPEAMKGRLRMLILVGESTPRDLVEIWVPNVTDGVAIGYGPAEAAVLCAGVTLGKRKSWKDEMTTGLIGYPLGCTLWVAEPEIREGEEMKLVSEGDVGELMVEGPTLARGYLNDKVKTAASFVSIPASWPLPQDAGPNGVIGNRRGYKTGDLVRKLTDGSGALVFVGRRDSQVKIRGMRIELTELESHLARNMPPGWHVCVEKVVLNKSDTLVCFVTRSTAAKSSPSVAWDGEETKFVTSQMPLAKTAISGMIPAPIIQAMNLDVPLAYLPLSSSGKTDRKTLRALAEGLSVDEIQQLRRGEDSTPRPNKQEELNPKELVMIELWALVLKIDAESISRNDNFGKLGGDSLRAIKLVTAARKRGIRLTAAGILKSPNLSSLVDKTDSVVNGGTKKEEEQFDFERPYGLIKDASHVEQLKQAAADMCQVGTEEVEDIMPIFAIQMYMLQEQSVIPMAWVERYMFQLPENIDMSRFVSALDATVGSSSCASLRTRIIPKPDSIPTTHKSPFPFYQAVLKHHPITLVNVGPEKAEEYLREDMKNPMHPGSPMSRMVIVHTSETTKSFVWTLSHVNHDGYAKSLLLDAINERYRGGTPAPFTPLARYVAGQSPEDHAAGRKFWKEYLAGSRWGLFPRAGGQPNAPPPSMQRIIRHVTMPKSSSEASRNSSGITTTTMIRVAWAIALETMSLSLSPEPAAGEAKPVMDALYQEALGGRNSTILGTDRVIAAALKISFGRLRLDPTPEATVDEVLSAAQDSYVQRMRHEDLTVPDLFEFIPEGFALRSCLTIDDEWLSGADVDKDVVGGGAQDGIFGGEILVEDYEPENLPILCRITMRKDGVVRVNVRYDASLTAPEDAERFAGILCDVFEKLAGVVVSGRGDRLWRHVIPGW